MTPLIVEDRALRMKLAAGELERLQDRHHLLDAGDRLQRLDLELRLVADHADDRARNPLAQMRRESQGRDPIDNMVDNLGCGMRLQDNDHQRFLERDREAAPESIFMRLPGPATARPVGPLECEFNSVTCRCSMGKGDSRRSPPQPHRSA